MKLFKKDIKSILENAVINEVKREKIQHIVINAFFAFVALAFTIVDFVRGFNSSAIATTTYTFLCGINVLFAFSKNKTIYNLSSYLFEVEVIALLTFFLIDGTPNGFSVIWALILPVLSMLMFKEKRGSILALVMLAILIFFMWIPFGTSLLNYDYGFAFRLRFPLVYVTFYLVSLFFHIILTKTYNQYRHLYTHDPLTNTLNRRGFDDLIKESTNKSSSDRVCVLICDLDNFKQVNDTYGHFAGDEVLKISAELLSNSCPLPICRWGGEEFAIFDIDGVLTVDKINDLCKTFGSTTKYYQGNEIKITISIGAVSIKKSANLDYISIFRQADECLYEAKNRGKNQIVFKNLD